MSRPPPQLLAVFPEISAEPEAAPAVQLTWEAVLEKLEEKMFMGDHILISDPANAVGEMEGDTLVLTAKNEPALEILRNSLEEIKAAAAAVAGKTVAVKLQSAPGVGEDRFADVENLFSKFNFGG